LEKEINIKSKPSKKAMSMTEPVVKRRLKCWKKLTATEWKPLSIEQMIYHIDKKRKALGIDNRERILADMAVKHAMELM
jgi:hypothetical protein